MPRSVTGRSTEGAIRGFTLLELLAVIAIIAVITGMAVLSLGDGGRDREMSEHARRLATLMELARQEVMLGAPTVGVAFTRHAYHFQHLQEVRDGVLEWRDIPGDETLRPRSLIDDEVEFELTVEGRRARLEFDPEQPAPNVFLEASGEVTPFELILTDEREPERRLRIVGEMDGSFTIERPDESGRGWR